MKKTKYDKAKDYAGLDYKKPKHLFVVIGNKIAAYLKKVSSNKDMRLLDVGGASGAFAYYLNERFRSLAVTVLEHDKSLVELGRRNVRSSSFVCGDANDMKAVKGASSDITTCIGVISIFDDFRKSINELIRVTKKGGVVYIVTLVNDYPLDCLIRYRYSNEKNGCWKTGLNIFSKDSLSGYFKRQRRVKSFSFEDFTLPFDLPKQADPVRTWTEKKGGRRIFVNGIMPVDLKIVTLKF